MGRAFELPSTVPSVSVREPASALEHPGLVLVLEFDLEQLADVLILVVKSHTGGTCGLCAAGFSTNSCQVWPLWRQDDCLRFERVVSMNSNDCGDLGKMARGSDLRPLRHRGCLLDVSIALPG